MSETPEVYDASAWEGRMDREYIIEVSPGYPIVCKQLSLVAELAAGKLPSELERFTIFEDFDGSEFKLIKGKVQKKTDVELSIEQQERWSNYLRIAARAMIRPRLRLRNAPDYKQGEVAPSDLTWSEVYQVARKAIREVVPPIATAPFPVDGELPDSLGAVGGVPDIGAVPQEPV